MHKYQALLISEVSNRRKLAKAMRRHFVAQLRIENRKGAMPLPK